MSLYQHWNPLFCKGNGGTAAGATLELEVELDEIGKFTIKAKIIEANAPTSLAWRYQLPVPGLFAWEYRFRLEQLGNEQLLFIQQSNFSGLLAPLYSFALGKRVLQGCESLNRAVKRWGERGNMKCMKC